ncbi:hypothetical protein BF17_16455 [Yersinia similis]|uniref:Uncharacterized protein n=1 Tax=Yersinia similis TaxID=367190 RepID=A0ABN4CV89_9GAMM|nr:hypothetical protein [Yersinia similis]AHK21986.1 hypothetical protein BF17_16455 [Yersinia similis]CFQ45200.1 Uncharacterised protein [Yersinia similis]
MEVDYMLIGYGMDGQIHRDEYPKNNIRIIEPIVSRSDSGHHGGPIKTFEVDTVTFNGRKYAIGTSRSTNSDEVFRLIDSSGVSPIPE